MNSKFSFKEAKEKIEIKDYLASLGFHGVRQNRADIWYKSPFHDEKTPSFKVNEKHQIWYDHSIGIGGDLIDFGRKFHGCSFAELLEKFKSFVSFQPEMIQRTVRLALKEQKTATDFENKRIKIVATRPIFKFYLKSYLQSRGISLDLASQFLREVDYTNSGGKEVNSKIYTALGFKNDQGGFELRSKYFKGSSAPKAPTFISNLSETEANKKPLEEQTIAIIEGFFSFLSFQTLWFHNKLDVPQPDNFLVLNSLSFFRKSFDFVEQFKTQMLFLDNDKSGQTATMEALERKKNYIDYSSATGNSKDLNALLIAINQAEIEKRPTGGRRI